MNDFYFTRHGMTDANHQKLLCGADWDIPLHADGHAQAAQAAVDYRKALSSVRSIGCSPLLRARQTAEYFAKELQVPIMIINDLKEQRLGDWEKAPWQDVPEFFTGEKDPPRGESKVELDARIKTGLRLAMQMEGPVLLVSHGAVWYALQRVLGLPSEQPGSCTVFHFHQESGGYQRTRL